MRGHRGAGLPRGWPVAFPCRRAAREGVPAQPAQWPRTGPHDALCKCAGSGAPRTLIGKEPNGACCHGLWAPSASVRQHGGGGGGGGGGPGQMLAASGAASAPSPPSSFPPEARPDRGPCPPHITLAHVSSTATTSHVRHHSSAIILDGARVPGKERRGLTRARALIRGRRRRRPWTSAVEQRFCA